MKEPDKTLKEQESSILKHLLDKPKMWVNPLNETSIVSFIHGFEARTGHREFTDKIKEYLQDEYDIFGSSLGWPYQIRIYAENQNIDWISAFQEIGNKILK